ncbi:MULTISPECIES: glycosyl hydrolase 53 family protein [unclassified Microbacterium]|uniref:glycosyl hydrolase 53 family protein n=1 Tax=unclassified Microbacterium TaxID=2609290 RepID=UPI003869EC95
MNRHLSRTAAIAAAVALAIGANANAAVADTGPVDAGIFVDKVDGLSADFTMGVDVSSYLSLIESGVVFRDDAGQPANLFEVLADHGVTDVRLRVWNDPFHSSTGQGYGGGNVDAARATEMGTLATEAGLGVLVDFHYSDFWADPAKQKAPKAWAGYTIDQKAAATKAYTVQSLEMMKAAGVDVEMVQVGNETNGGVAGETGWANMSRIFQAGSEGVDQVFPDALVAVHFTNPERGNYATIAENLRTYGVDYDVFASSYYPYWHGTVENLQSELDKIVTQFGKKVMVAETSWATTLDDADGHANVIDTPAEATQYPVSVQGQARSLRDVIAAVSDVQGGAGLGVYYWEPAWLPVGPASTVEANKALWERDGSGWASSAAGEYDPVDAGEYFGGSAWDNQALFAADGTPLESLSTFEYVYTGAATALEVVAHDPVTLSFADAASVALPASVRLQYNDGSTASAPVEWSDALSWITSPGTYTVSGVTGAGFPVTASVTVEASVTQHVANGGFEDGAAPWSLAGTGSSIDWTPDAGSGERAFRFWAAETYSTAVTQTITGLPAGTYVLSAVAHGGAFTAGAATLRAVTSEGTYETPLRLTAWGERNPSSVPVVVGASGEAVVSGSLTDVAGGTWGAFDDFSLIREVAPSTVDTTGLAAAVAGAEGIDRASYSASSLASLDLALEKARIVLAASAPTADQVKTASSLIAKATGALTKAFTGVSTPKISGNVVVGKRVTASVTSTPAASVKTYRWFADGAPIAGAKSAGYTIKKADGGKKLAVQVTLARRGYESVTATSAASTVAKTFSRVSTPKISGAAVVGKKLTASIRVSPSANQAFEWFVDGRTVGMGASYTPVKADAGKRVVVKATVTKDGYQSVTKVSAATRLKR